jgi:2-oxoglutarate dehydrogenase E1 component
VYASDLARMVQAPIFHVNGDDPEACVRAAHLAYAFRQTFERDVVIDLWCYRRWGHNETDEPAFTQPTMYRTIAQLPSVRTRYTERLVARGELSPEDAEASLRDFSERLERAFDETQDPSADGGVNDVELAEPAPPEPTSEIDTTVPRERLQALAEELTRIPDDFEVHPKLEKWLEERRTQLERDTVDWAFAEALAFGSLLDDGVSVRLTGQDTRRGTFSQRHAVLVDQRTGQEYMPLQHTGGTDAQAWIYDSLLSEHAAMGFEYGYSVANPETLVLWEAQFGDFVNGAQIVIDQFLVSAEDKWTQRSGLVLLLPHGYEGQGPEHSSARIERFLTLAAEENIEIVVPSTASQYFHLLRGQALRHPKKPLIVATPKSFLRARGAASTVAALADGRFEPVLPDPDPPDDPSRIVLCQGKLFHELAAARRERGSDVQLVRLERCYPFPADELRAILGDIGERDVVWAQEEPENMGAARFAAWNVRERLAIAARIIARPESASPATGSLTLHKLEQEALIDRILSPER